jgi:hypothetical protein
MDRYELVSAIDNASFTLKRIVNADVLSTDGKYFDQLRLNVNDQEVEITVHFYTSGYGDAAPDAARESLERLRKLRRYLSGTWDKNYIGSTVDFSHESDDGYNITLSCDRTSLCKRIVKGVEEIPEKIIPASTREIIDWECTS